MRLHLVALPHVRLGTPDTHLCAYSSKTVKLCKMLGVEHEILLYAPESDPVPGATLVDCLSDSERVSIFGKDDPNRLPAWPTDLKSVAFNLAAGRKIRERAEPHDLVLLTGGLTHLPIKQALPEFLCIEPFVGYFGVIGGNCHAAYESYSHMAQVAAKQSYDDIRWYDRVIPPFVDADEFPFVEEKDRSRDYLLFVGRLIPRKGPHIALQIAQACGLPLVVAGSGGTVKAGVLYGQDVELEGVDYRGPVGIVERARLMANAKAVLVPTTYAEPGGNVAIEAMMAGTPVIAPDWGVFAETVKPGLTGFHFRTLKSAVEAVNQSGDLAADIIRACNISYYSLQAIRLDFNDWFDDLQGLWDEGWGKL